MKIETKGSGDFDAIKELNGILSATRPRKKFAFKSVSVQNFYAILNSTERAGNLSLTHITKIHAQINISYIVATFCPNKRK